MLKATRSVSGAVSPQAGNGHTEVAATPPKSPALTGAPGKFSAPRLGRLPVGLPAVASDATPFGALGKLPPELRAQVYAHLPQDLASPDLRALASTQRAFRGELEPQIEANRVACAYKTPAMVESFPALLRELPMQQRLVPLFNFAFHEFAGEPLDKEKLVTKAFADALGEITDSRLHKRLSRVLSVPRSEQRLELWRSATPEERSVYIRSIAAFEASAQHQAPTLQNIKDVRSREETSLALMIAIQKQKERPDYDVAAIGRDFCLDDPKAVDMLQQHLRLPPDLLQNAVTQAETADAEWAIEARTLGIATPGRSSNTGRDVGDVPSGATQGAVSPR